MQKNLIKENIMYCITTRVFSTPHYLKHFLKTFSRVGGWLSDRGLAS